MALLGEQLQENIFVYHYAVHEDVLLELLRNHRKLKLW